jgi:hypothetical protein
VLHSRSTATTLPLSGVRHEVIVPQAAELPLTLISMATHGYGLTRCVVPGSVANHVRLGTDVPPPPDSGPGH